MALFKVSRDITINNVGFTEIDMTDKNMFEDYINKSKYPIDLWYNNFTYLYTFNDSHTRKVVWKIIDDMLCPFVVNNKQLVYMLVLPMGDADKEKLNKVIHKCFKVMEQVNDGERDCEIFYIGSEQIEWLDESFKLVGGKGYVEYHYDIQSIISLKGKDNAYIRRKINKFNSLYPNAKWREYEEKDYDQLMLLQKAWQDTAGEKYFRIIDSTYYRSTIKNHKKLDHKIFIVEIHGRVVGMISGAYLSDDKSHCWCFLRKPMNNFEGLSEFLIYKLCCELKEGITLNDGGDGNEDGLRFFKTRFPSVRTQYVATCQINKKRGKKA